MVIRGDQDRPSPKDSASTKMGRNRSPYPNPNGLSGRGISQRYSSACVEMGLQVARALEPAFGARAAYFLCAIIVKLLPPNVINRQSNGAVCSLTLSAYTMPYVRKNRRTDRLTAFHAASSKAPLCNLTKNLNTSPTKIDQRVKNGGERKSPAAKGPKKPDSIRLSKCASRAPNGK